MPTFSKSCIVNQELFIAKPVYLPVLYQTTVQVADSVEKAQDESDPVLGGSALVLEGAILVAKSQLDSLLRRVRNCRLAQEQQVGYGIFRVSVTRKTLKTIKNFVSNSRIFPLHRFFKLSKISKSSAFTTKSEERFE